MAYTALYRVWRPSRFADVVGQEHITKVLIAQVQTGRTVHAYLFAGPRGTGKTSLAKIFARAVNCQRPQNAEPCEACEPCLHDADGGSVDIVEIDAASNNGVDSVRELRDRVGLMPAFLKYKVYIIDEVHMLSKGAFNALLKTLEEPPAHVIFILATTEPHKLPATIRSRCQRFDFRRITQSDIIGQLTRISQAEGYIYEDDALAHIARAAEGGLRDAVSILDQCAGSGNITVQNVAAALGGGDTQSLYALAGSIARYEEKEALEGLREMISAGADTRVLIHDLADLFRRMMWITAGATPEEADIPLAALAKAYGKTACVRALDILLRKEYEMRQNLRADIVLETAVMALMAPQDDAAAPDEARIEKLETRLAALETRAAAGPIAATDTPSAKPAEKKTEKPKAEKVPAASTASRDVPAASLWQKVLQKLKSEDYMNYSHASRASGVSLMGDRFEVMFDSHEVSAEYLKQDAARKAVEAVLLAAAGRPVGITVVYRKRETAGMQPEKFFGEDIEEI